MINPDTNTSMKENYSGYFLNFGYLVAVVALWTTIIVVLGTLRYNQTYKAAVELIKNSARDNFERDVLYRKWATMHGGVYAPVSAVTPPNPYLTNVDERDIETPSGKKLTLINPAYMTRQVHELGKLKKGIQGHITSLKPIRPANKPDEWETTALQSFKAKDDEYYTFDTINNEFYFRLMKPLVTEKGCLKCHAFLGYTEGDIRGGISISVPWEAARASLVKQRNGLLLAYSGIWLVGFIGIFISWRKITTQLLKRIRAEAILKEQNQQLELTVAQKDKLFSIIAHDLRSPFNTIIGFSDLLATESKNMNINDIENYSNIINASTHQTLRLLENLLDWARLQQGLFTIHPKHLLIHDLAREVMGILAEGAARKNITISNTIPEKTLLFADEEMIKTILRNLINNAIKFTGTGGHIEISSKESENEIQITVTDTGIGIDKAYTSGLFDIGSGFSRKGTENEKGTGLGLILCKEFVEKHHGKIWVESETGKGSVFTFSIPTAKMNNQI